MIILEQQLEPTLHAGAVTGLMKMGDRAVHMLVVPAIPLVLDHLAKLQAQTAEAAAQQDIQRLQGALRLACSRRINAALDQRWPLLSSTNACCRTSFPVDSTT